MKKYLIAYIHSCGIDRADHVRILKGDLVKIAEKLGYAVESQRLNDGILGEADFEKLLINLSVTLPEESPRWRFTLAHELGHIILHSEIFQEAQLMSVSDAPMIETEEYDEGLGQITDKNLKRLEIQANIFASALLVSYESFQKEYAKVKEQLVFRNFPYLRLDKQSCNIFLCSGQTRTLEDMPN